MLKQLILWFKQLFKREVSYYTIRKIGCFYIAYRKKKSAYEVIVGLDASKVIQEAIDRCGKEHTTYRSQGDKR